MNAPNRLTLVRIAASPLFLIAFAIDTAWSIGICLFLLAVFEFTDFYDGQLARKKNLVTDFGKLMDPFADSISRFTIFLCFLSAELAPVWIIAVFFYRDVFVAILRVFAIRENVVVSARPSGKLKAMFQAGSTAPILIIYFLQKINVIPEPLYLFAQVKLATVLIAIAALVTLYSGIDYWNGNKHIILQSLQRKQ
ncbi:MAG: CDP-diacylglycerol--glycerol-3-phosphate 3-phosphatidyltransferase [candidate division KSB1 bacterium]|nr:CDP-diacylglycerol--glycerol-3-phosphate 3-phosphatidyltransferase [candidate division KSB1 bacterium]